jgi:glycosyltransferase involved in cell wall biosynthesis
MQPRHLADRRQTRDAAPPARADLAAPPFRNLAILNDYVRIPYANGSSFASQFFYREFHARGHEVTIVGPRDPQTQPHELPRRYVELPSVPLKNHPGVHLALPDRRSLRRLSDAHFDIALGQSSTELLQAGVWLYREHGVPFLPVHTVHLPSVYNVVLPESLVDNRAVNALFSERLIPFVEKQTAAAYNQSSGVIVLADGLKRYWEARGVTVPIHVIPRPIEPKIFDQPQPNDPYPARFARGGRLVVVCRHTREKGVSRLLEIFARHVAPVVPEATLTLVGDGPDHDAFRAEAEALGVAHRCEFPGEVALRDVPAYYRHGDVFVYTSLSETYGQVVSEALWCGIPVVALADGMGVEQQVDSGRNGVLVAQSPRVEETDRRFGAEVVALLRDEARRRALGEAAAVIARDRSDPRRCIDRFYAAFESARQERDRLFASRKRPPYRRTLSMVNWTWIHLVVAGMGLLREPATVNRHGRKPPTWDELLDVQTPAPAAAQPAAAAPVDREGSVASAAPNGERRARVVAVAPKRAERELRLRAQAAANDVTAAVEPGRRLAEPAE